MTDKLPRAQQKIIDWSMTILVSSLIFTAAAGLVTGGVSLLNLVF